MEEEKFQQINHVRNEHEDVFYLPDVMDYLFDKVITDQSVLNVI